jgi:uncharacterized protein (TIGR00266 family)
VKYSIDEGPSYSVLNVTLAQGESVVSESGAMAWMDPGLEIKTGTRGGFLKGLKRKVLAGESFFQNTYTAPQADLSVAFAPACAGDTSVYHLDGNELFLQRGAYLASTPDVHCDTKFEGLKGFFNAGLFILRVTGTGDLFFSSYGDIREIEIDGKYVIDNGYAVAWEPTLDYRLTAARKIRSFLFSDQMLLEFSGRGKLWVQSRSAHGFANWIHPFRSVESKSSN